MWACWPYAPLQSIAGPLCIPCIYVHHFMPSIHACILKADACRIFRSSWKLLWDSVPPCMHDVWSLFRWCTCMHVYVPWCMVIMDGKHMHACVCTKWRQGQLVNDGGREEMGGSMRAGMVGVWWWEWPTGRTIKPAGARNDEMKLHSQFHSTCGMSFITSHVHVHPSISIFFSFPYIFIS